MENNSKARWFSARSEKVSVFEALAGLLIELLDKPDEAVVLGSIKEGMNTRRMMRHSNGPSATLDDTPCHVMHIDIDGLLCPAAVDMNSDPASAMEYARGVLVEVAPELAGVKLFDALSSSAGVKTKDIIRVHLWFLLQTSLTTKQMKSWARQVNAIAAEKLAGKLNKLELIDTSIYTAEHIHYTARPRFGSGLHDPFEGDRRWAKLDGLEELAPIAPPAQETKRTKKATVRLLRVDAPRANVPVSLPSVEVALMCIPNHDFTWDEFKRVAMAVRGAVGDYAEAGRKLFHLWAHKSSKYDPTNTNKAWGEVCNSPPNEITGGTLWWLAAWGKTEAATGASELPTDDSWKESKTRLPVNFDPAPTRAPVDELYAEADVQIWRVFACARDCKRQNAVNMAAAEIDETIKLVIDNPDNLDSQKVEKAKLRRKKLEYFINEEVTNGGHNDPRVDLFGGIVTAQDTLVTADCSSGKSRALVYAAAANPDIVIDHVSPNMDLAREAFSEYNEVIGERVALHLGMNQSDPDDQQEKMCRRIEEIKAYTAAGGHATDLCGSKRCGFCPLIDKCGYQRHIKNEQYRNAQVMVSAGTLSIENHNRWVDRQKDLLVLDDFPITQLFRSKPSETVTWNDFADPMMHDQDGNVVAEGKLFKFVDDMKPWLSSFDGRKRMVSWQDIIVFDELHLRPVPMTARHDLNDLANLFCKLVYDVRKFKPSTATDLIFRLKHIAKWNARMIRLSRFCRTLDDDSRYHGILVARNSGSDVGFQICRFVNKDPASMHVPTLVLDGTGDSYLWSRYFGHTVHHTQQPFANYSDGVFVEQVYDNLFGKTAWTPSKDTGQVGKERGEAATNKTRRNNVDKLSRFISALEVKERERGGSVGVIVYKDTHDHWQTNWTEGAAKPQLVSASKALGINTMQDHSVLVVIGRPAVRAEDVELMASALEARKVPRAEYYRRTGVYYMVDGSVELAPNQEYHIDDFVERMRRQAVLAPIYQWVQRGRLARRKRPLKLLLLTSCAVPWLVVNQLITASEVLREATIYHELMSGGIIPLKHPHSTFAFLLSKAAEAVKKAFQYDDGVREDAKASMDNFRDGLLGDGWSEWTVITTDGKKYQLALRVAANAIGNAKALLERFAVSGVEVKPTLAPNSVKSGEFPYSSLIRDFSLNDGVSNSNSSVQFDVGALAPLIARGIYVSPSAYGAAAVIAIFLGCKVTDVENMRQRYPEAINLLQKGFETAGGSLWRVKLGRKPVEVRLANILAGDAAGARIVLGALADALLLPAMVRPLTSVGSHDPTSAT